MALRVTRQYNEVLATGNGKLRVTRQYVEILANTYQTINENPSHNLSLTQNVVRGPLVYDRDASNILNLSQEIRPGQTFFENIENELNLVSILSRVLEANASNTMNLTQQIVKFYIPNDFIPMESVINFSQQADWDAGNYKHIVQDLNLAQQLDWQGPRYSSIRTYLVLNDEVDWAFGCPWLPVEFEDNLNLASVLNRTYDLDANNVIALTHDTYRKQNPITTLNLGQSLGWGKTKSIPPTIINLTQTINLCAIYQRTFEHSSVVGHALTYSTDKLCGDKQYTPYIGESTIGDVTPPATDEPLVQSSTTNFKLTYPFSVPTETIELRAPELDNIDRIAFNRINRETRGGKLTIFADPNWPQTQTVIVTFIGLLKTEIDNLLDFLVSHIGKEIGMRDWEGREWIGIITTPNEAAVQDGKEKWTITFEFEGILVDSYIPGDRLNLIGTLALEMHYQRNLIHDIDLSQSATFLLV